MNIIEKLVESSKRHFVDGGKLVKLYPLFESIETVFFAPARSTVTAPNVRDNLDIKRFMMLVIVALV